MLRKENLLIIISCSILAAKAYQSQSGCANSSPGCYGPSRRCGAAELLS